MILTFSALWWASLGCVMGGLLTLPITEVSPTDRRRAPSPFYLVLATLILLAPSIGRPLAFMVSDSYEYAVGALRLVSGEGYNLLLGGITHPPRYAPWFSLFALAPFAATGALGWAGPCWAAITVLAAYHLALRLGGESSALWSAIAILALPGFFYFSREPMTDVPTAALTLLALIACLKIREQGPRWNSTIALSFLTLSAAAFRPLSILYALPALLTIGTTVAPIARRVMHAAVFAIPILLMVLATLEYNAEVFGAALRSGYNYWVPIPYDYSSLVFSFYWVDRNVSPLLLDSGLALLLLIAVAIGVSPARGRLNHQTRRAARYSALFLVPILLVHLLYFYVSIRFALPITVILTPLIVSSIFQALPKYGPLPVHRISVAFALAALVTRFTFMGDQFDIDGFRALETINSLCNSSTTLVIARNPLTTEIPQKQQCGEIVPISRRIEYASAPVSVIPLKLPFPGYLGWGTMREALLKAGARDVFPRTALDDPQYLQAQAKSGRVVLVDVRESTAEEQRKLRVLFELEQLAPQLFRIRE